MKNLSFCRTSSLVAGLLLATCAQFSAQAQMSVQRPSNVVETGSNSWYYLVMEGESFIDASKQAAFGTGFDRVWNDQALSDFYGTPMLVTNTPASMQGALGTLGPTFGRFADKVTYQVVFSTPGDYYMYMRFTMFENGGNTGHYLNEDSFFFPPGFNQDPQFDWPVPGTTGSDDGGYCEGCCGTAGFLFILDYQGNGSRTQQTADTNYWEGSFHWNQLLSSQFLNPSVGTPSVPFHYVVTPAMVGVPQNFTIAYREQGVTIDLFLFSTHTNMMNDYTQAQLDDLLVKKVNVQDPGNTVATPSNSWSFLVMEGESFMAKSNRTATVGFSTVAPGNTNIDAYGTPILATNTTASDKGALFTQTTFSQWADKINYQVQFASTGTYYLYMRFTMFENGGNLSHYLNEDSYFVPPEFNKDPQYDWPIPQPTPNGQSGGYCEGGLGTSGFLWILDYQGDGSRTDRSNDTNYWEGNFHWNQCISSQFMNPTTVGQPNSNFNYVVTSSMLGVPQNFSIGYREGGVTPDLFLFCTRSNLLNDYSQEQLDALILQPRLYITRSGTNVVISWPTSAKGYVLQSTASLTPAAWTTVQTPAITVGTRYNLTLTPSASRQYFRLKQR